MDDQLCVPIFLPGWVALGLFFFSSFVFLFSSSFFWGGGDFLLLHPQLMEVPRLGVELELQLPTYTTATATPDPSPPWQTKPQLSGMPDP